MVILINFDIYFNIKMVLIINITILIYLYIYVYKILYILPI